MKKLLIVDDDPDILEAMELMFASQGFHTASTLKGEEAYEKAQVFEPDLIILDYLLSGIQGTDICKGLKRTPDTRHIPIILFSAHPGAGEAASHCGADDFIAKPFIVTDLLEKVKRLIGNV